MSEDKFELIRRGLEEFYETQQAVDLFADDLVFDFSGFRGWIEDEEYYGPEGFNDQMARWTAPFETYTTEVTEMIDAGGDDVLGLGVQRGVVRDTGVEVEMPLAQIWTVRDGKLRRIRIFASHEDAYAAAGIEPPAQRMKSL